MRKPKKVEPIHPGEILLDEFLKPLGISQYRLDREVTSLASSLGAASLRSAATKIQARAPARDRVVPTSHVSGAAFSLDAPQVRI